MTRARRHLRLLAALAFGLLALVAELVGRSLTHRFDIGRHVATPSYAESSYYPILLAVVKLGIALLLARLAWRFVRARAAARAARRILAAVGARPPQPRPRVRFNLSPRLWLLFFGVTASIYLVQTDAEQLSAGRWPLLAPWLHSSALPVFALLSVVVALFWRAVAAWLAEYETYAEAAVAHARRLAAEQLQPARSAAAWRPAPRQLFGLAFQVRPPPLGA